MHTVYIYLKYKIYVVIKFSYERIIIDIFGIFIIKIKSEIKSWVIGFRLFSNNFFFFLIRNLHVITELNRAIISVSELCMCKIGLSLGGC